VPRLHIAPSPCQAVVISPYDQTLFPEFKQIFEPQPEGSPSAEIPLTVVLENRSEKAITGLSYRWRKLDQSGKVRNHTTSSDSYLMDIFRAVAEPGSCHLIGPSGSLDELLWQGSVQKTAPCTTLFTGCNGDFATVTCREENSYKTDWPDRSFNFEEHTPHERLGSRPRPCRRAVTCP
jgi:hypothetical protein